MESAAVQLESAMKELLHDMQNVNKQKQKRIMKSLVSKVFHSSYPYVIRFLQVEELVYLESSFETRLIVKDDPTFAAECFEHR